MTANKKSKRNASVPQQWKRNAINGAIAVAFSGMVAAPAWAAPCANSISVTLNATCQATSTQSITVTSTGVVNGNYTGIDYVGGLLTPGVLTNAGTISVNPVLPVPYAAGVYIGGLLSGTLTNSGTIKATAKNGAGTWASAYGVDVSSDLTGTLTNSGTISATAATVNAGSRAYASAYGLYVGNNLTGTLTNSGTISATAATVNAGSRAYASAYGLYVGNNLTGTLTNSGTISATATANAVAYGVYASAYGVYVDGNLGTLTNSGTISATATANEGWWASATAYGVYVWGNLTTLTNSGTISVSASGSSATAYGVYVGGNLGSLTNSGTINVSATGTANGSDAYAYGIYVGANLTGTLTNSGTINVRATSLNSDAYAATGIYVSGALSLGGVLNNTGTISATAIASFYASDARGIYIGSVLAGSLTNSGTISATAISTSGYNATAYGILVDSTLSGSLTNSGTISATARNDNNSSATATGVAVATLSGTLTNSGTISATATANGSGYAYGVSVNTLNGVLNNSGTISGTADDPYNGYSLYVGSGTTGIINNQAGGVLSGNIYVHGTVAVNNAGTIAIPAGVDGYINNNYTQQTGGVLQIGATDELTYGQLYVGGTANLTASNTIAVRATIGNTLAAGDVLNDVLGSNTLTGLVPTNTVNVIGTPLYTYIGLVDAGGEIDVTIASVNTITGVLGSLGNASLTGIGATLDGLLVGYTGTEPLDPLLDAIYATNSKAELANLVSQFVPITSTTQATANMLRGTSRIIQARQDGNKGLSSGDKFYGNRAVWLKPFGSFADQSDRNGVSGYEAKTYGMAFGADTELSKTARVGAAFVYASSDVDGNSSIARQNADIDSYQAILYGSYSLDDRTELNLQADFGVHGNDSKRSIPAFGLTASGSFISLSSHLGVGVGRTYTLSPKSSFTPSVRADYTQIRNRGYTETGAGVYNLNVGSNTTDELILAVDGRYTYAVSGGTTFVVNLGAGYDALSEAASVTSTFVGGGAAFTTQGIDPSPWLVRGGLGMVMKAVNNMPEVNARYDIEGRQDYTNQTASVKLRWSF